LACRIPARFRTGTLLDLKLLAIPIKKHVEFAKALVKSYVLSSVSDPDSLIPDPDPAF
jgi:hypothetical protein